MSDLPPKELQSWLEWAGARLIAMPGGRIGPKEPGTFWPEYSQDRFQVLEFRGALSVRVAAPSRDEIPLVDEILELPSLCADVLRRRVLHARALVHPVSGRHLYSWARVARLLNKDPSSVKYMHGKALVEVVTKVDQQIVCRIRGFGLPIAS